MRWLLDNKMYLPKGIAVQAQHDSQSTMTVPEELLCVNACMKWLNANAYLV